MWRARAARPPPGALSWCVSLCCALWCGVVLPPCVRRAWLLPSLVCGGGAAAPRAVWGGAWCRRALWGCAPLLGGGWLV